MEKPLLTSTHQDEAHLDITDALGPEAVFIVNYWAMKFLPQWHRESQTDWFRKCGISWHISVVCRRMARELKWQGLQGEYIHAAKEVPQW